jgi:hypothetical protein
MRSSPSCHSLVARLSPLPSLTLAQSILSVVTASFIGSLVATAQELPRFDISRTCRAEVTSAGDMIAASPCANDEQRSHDELAKQWSQLPTEIKKTCVSTATESGGIESYVELLTCIQIVKDASKLPNELD